MLCIGLLLVLVSACDDQISSPTMREATTLALEPDSVTLAEGDTAHVEATPLDDAGETVPGYEITWETTNGDVATVSDEGRVIAHAPGTTAVTASALKAAGGQESTLSAQAAVAVEDSGSAQKTGHLEVSTSTTGDDQDADGYTVSVDEDSTQAIGTSGSVTFADLTAGDHQVALSGIASNCSVDGDNPRTLAVTEGSTASTTFNVSCQAQTGDLEVSTSTTGDDQDSDGYTVSVDGSDSQTIGNNATVTFSDLSAGDHEVELSGIQSNCSVDGQNPRTVSVEANTTATTSFSVSCVAESGSMDKSGTLWGPYLEWSLANPSYSDNPFDLIATVTFSHQGSSETHTTEMFYAGDDTWKFRFTGTRTGTWSFTTESDDPELDGKSGTVYVDPNSDPDERGFLTHDENQFAVQLGEGEVEGFLLNVYQIDDDGPYKHTHITTFANNTVSRTREYVRHARERGFTAVYVMLNNNLLEMGAYAYDNTSSENPDLSTFQVLDELIETAHAEGMRIYFWRWGDETRNWTPVGLSGGINGTVDRRITRYFAARLGPLPGWSMGYGFDLHEWTNRSQLRTWVDDFQEWLGWEHLLSARSADLDRSSGTVNGYAQGDNEYGDFSTDEFPSYSTLVDDLNSDSNNPHLLEERNVLGRWGVDEVDTRRLMWRTAMAGGIGGWYGFMDGIDPVFSGDEGYPNPEELKAHATFWEDRFLLDFRRANTLTDGFALASSDNSKYVFYKEEASSINVDLSGMSGSQSAVAVNTGEPYSEVDLGTLSPEQQTIKLPKTGDWAIAVGQF